MPHKDEETYIVLFKQLRLALIAEFNDIGRPKTVMMDFEIAAHNALKKVFPEWTLKTCYFHFIKNITDQAKKKGLSLALRLPEFKRWFSELIGKYLIDVIN